MTTGLDAWTRTRPDRCPGCGHHVATQGHGPTCTPTTPEALAAAGMAAASSAHPDDRAKVDAAIRQLASRGGEFSSNDARALHNVTGPVVGAAFSAAAKSGLIVRVGYVPSTEPGTHAHPVAVWRAAA